MIICKCNVNNLKQIYNILIHVMKTKDPISDTQLQEIKYLISKEVNPKNKAESDKLLSDSKLLQQTMQNAADNFVKQAGCNMTYSEIREMMG